MKRIEIPSHWIGKPIEGSIERVLNSKKDDIQEEQPAFGFEIQNPRAYIQVPQYGIVIAAAETHKGDNFYETLEALSQEHLKMPTPAQFMAHWNNVREASQGTRSLLYADGTPVGKDIAEDLWKYLSSGHRNGCWTWLNAFFRNEDNTWKIYTDLIKKTNQQGENYLEGNPTNLESCLHKDCHASLKFNSQGLPVEESPNKSYKQGENIYFWSPIDKRVAGFDAGSYGASLDCVRDPEYSNSVLGVFGCAAGSAKNFGKT